MKVNLFCEGTVRDLTYHGKNNEQFESAEEFENLIGQ